MKIERDNWLSGQIGKSVYNCKAEGPFIEFESTVNALNCSKVQIANQKELDYFLAFRFKIITIALTYERSRANRLHSHSTHYESESICPAFPEYHDDLLDIAEHGFEFSRFHQDPLIGRELGNKIKRNWLKSSLAGTRGDSVIVYKNAENVDGYLSIILRDDRIAMVDLIGVRSNEQKKGIGKALMDSFMFRYRNSENLQASTQINNIPAIRLYESCGFRLMDSHYVLHYHKNY